MALITWTNELSIGINSIDAQHKNLIKMINALNDALIDGTANDMIHEIFNELVKYTSVHFDYEEKLFEQYNYKESASHNAEHRALKEQVRDLQKKMEDGDFMISIEVMFFLKSWLTDHILKTDKAYSDFLIAQGVR